MVTEDTTNITESVEGKFNVTCTPVTVHAHMERACAKCERNLGECERDLRECERDNNMLIKAAVLGHSLHELTVRSHTHTHSDTHTHTHSCRRT